MTKIAKKSFVEKIFSEFNEVCRYLIGVRSKADKQVLRSEMAADKEEVLSEVRANKATADAQAEAAKKRLTACEAKEKELEERISEDEETIGNGLGALQAVLDTEEDGTVKFEGTNYLDDCTTFKEALIKLDTIIANNI